MCIRDSTKRLEAIEGLMADPTQKIEGCRFADRCKYATAACKKAQKMREVTPGHFKMCIRDRSCAGKNWPRLST